MPKGDDFWTVFSSFFQTQKTTKFLLESRGWWLLSFKFSLSSAQEVSVLIGRLNLALLQFGKANRVSQRWGIPPG